MQNTLRSEWELVRNLPLPASLSYKRLETNSSAWMFLTFLHTDHNSRSKYKDPGTRQMTWYCGVTWFLGSNLCLELFLGVGGRTGFPVGTNEATHEPLYL